jgi:hypothetical protein
MNSYIMRCSNWNAVKSAICGRWSEHEYKIFWDRTGDQWGPWEHVWEKIRI